MSVVQVERNEDGRRRVVSLQEINGMEGDVITMSELFTFERAGVDKDGNVLGSMRPTGIIPAFHQARSLSAASTCRSRCSRRQVRASGDERT